MYNVEHCRCKNEPMLLVLLLFFNIVIDKVCIQNGYPSILQHLAVFGYNNDLTTKF